MSRKSPFIAASVLLTILALYVGAGLLVRQSARAALSMGDRPRLAVQRYERVRRFWPFLLSSGELAVAYMLFGSDSISRDYTLASVCLSKAERLAPLPYPQFPLLKASAAAEHAELLLRHDDPEAALARAESAMTYWRREWHGPSPEEDFAEYGLYRNLVFCLVRASSLLGEHSRAVEVLEEAIDGYQGSPPILSVAELAVHRALVQQDAAAREAALTVLSDEQAGNFAQARAHYALMLCARHSGDAHAAEHEEALARALMLLRFPEGGRPPKGYPWFREDDHR